MLKFFQKPLVQCLLIGGLIAGWQYSQEPLPEITIARSQIDAAYEQVRESLGNRAIEIEETNIIDQLAEDEIIYQRAKLAGYDRLPGVITRLSNVAEFLQIVPAGATLEQRYEAALAMKLDETDIVVRRQMVTLYRTALKSNLNIPPPDIIDIQSYYEENPPKFTSPERYRFSHIYFQDNDDNGEQNALHTLASLNSDDEVVAPEEAIKMGNVFYGGHHFPLQSASQVARHLGSQFSTSLKALTEKTWSDPVRSSFGWHLVWIEEKTPSALRPIEDVREIIVRDLSTKARDKKFRETLDEMKQGYNIVVEPRLANDPVSDSNSASTDNDVPGESEDVE